MRLYHGSPHKPSMKGKTMSEFQAIGNSGILVADDEFANAYQVGYLTYKLDDSTKTLTDMELYALFFGVMTGVGHYTPIQTPIQALVLLCQKRDIDHLLDFLEDYAEDASIVKYGYTSKQQDGFIAMHWYKPMPFNFQEMQLKQDTGILDYVVYDLPALSHSPQPTTL